MSETPPAGGDAGAAPSMRVLAQYLKDHSFENPKAPQSFVENGEQPSINVNVDVNGRGLGNNQYEVELSVSARATRGADVAFVVETAYAGVFEIQNVPQDQLEPLMLVECPRLLFPFIRQIIADTTIAGNFPPIMLDPIDFFAIYQQRRAAAAQQSAQA
ncbi:MAG: protein-export chaperone SecB [Planctomycetota bacterium]